MPSSAFRQTHFATTRWTLVHDAAAGGDTRAVAALNELLGCYWQPLYRYARRTGKSREDAEDLVQGFMAHLIEAAALRRGDPARGRFRTFLLASFNHWMINEWKHGSRAKRGGGIALISLDWQHAETGLTAEPADSRSPDLLYDREWALALLDTVLASLERICLAEIGAAAFAALRPSLTADTARIRYSEVAATLGVNEGAARVAVHRLRKRYRHLLTAEITRTLSDPGQAEEELRALFAALAE
jgi:RNA polymerase sigma-70 factor (ECF subfamily)